jgi:arsenate reductase-like glutaredoxin family protein
MAPTELRRFTSRFTARALLDESARAYRDSGLSYLRLDENEAFERLLNNQSLLRLPLVRIGANVSAGVDERAWKSSLSAS